jgi:hypothetical protein
MRGHSGGMMVNMPVRLIPLLLAASPMAPLYGDAPVVVDMRVPSASVPTKTKVRLFGFSPDGRMAVTAEYDPGGMDGPDRAVRFDEVDLASGRVAHTDDVYYSLPLGGVPDEAREVRRFIARVKRRLLRFTLPPTATLQSLPVDIDGVHVEAEFDKSRGLSGRFQPGRDEDFLRECNDGVREQALLLRTDGDVRAVGKVRFCEGTLKADRPKVLGFLRGPGQAALVLVVVQRACGTEAHCWPEFRFFGAATEAPRK